MNDHTISRILDENNIERNPFSQFRKWFDETIQHGISDANAMTLATATRDGKPSARIVLLKSFDERGFCFFTNYESTKGKRLEENPNAALVFFWQPLERQVRIEGAVSRMTDAESDEYFHSRPVESQIGAHASPQSRMIPDREFLDERFRQLTEEYKNSAVPRPTYWGGYRLAAHTIEFWQGRQNRLHDRLLFRKDGNAWKLERLAP